MAVRDYTAQPDYTFEGTVRMTGYPGQWAVTSSDSPDSSQQLLQTSDNGGTRLYNPDTV